MMGIMPRTVKDTGPGIPKEELPHVLRDFIG